MDLSLAVIDSIELGTRDTDAARILTGPRVAALAFRSTLENGDVFVNLPRINRASNPYSLSLQLIEADRVCNEGWKGDETTSNGSMIAGVKKNTRGEPLSYAVCNRHPVSLIDRTGFAWREIPAYGAESGLPNILHLYEQLRPDQTRGLPYLTPVIEAFKMLDRYTEAELMAAVVSAMLTVFIKSEADFSGFGTAPLAPMQPTAETGGSTSDTSFKLASGAILALRPGEDIATMNPGRPNTSFDPFVLAILRQIGVGLGLPFEVLIKHFTSSYSAARAALLDAWKFFIERREWLASQLYQPIYEIFLYEAIALGRINAPGYFDDPLIRLAYSGAQWTGPARGMIDETKEVQAATDRVDAGMATMQEEVAALTGTDWEAKLPRIRKERAILAGLGLPLKPTAGPGAPPQDSNSNPNPHDEEGGNALSQ